ncbi:MAG TPA: glycosyl hydrolase family 18 protein, partial [Spirochaetia bacterium]|nr:glycosyl hydrolase family 18 protein [Spirochaetia bacterium]
DMDAFSPLWYHVGADGSLKTEVQPQAVSVARKDKLKIIPLVNLVSNQDAILTNATARANAVNNLVQAVKSNNWDGLNIDFEFIPTGAKDFSYDRPLLTAFITDLHGKLKALGKETDMSVLPHYQVSADVSSIYDYSHLAPYLDHVTLMTYDKSQEGSLPGPVAPFSWVEKNITTAMSQGFKPEQICLGVATYGYNWPAGQSGGFSQPTKAIMQKADNLGVQVKWSSEFQEPFYYYTDSEGNQREVWFENEDTLLTKIDLVKKYRIYGICIWRLGFEDPSFWSVITKNIPK